MYTMKKVVGIDEADVAFSIIKLILKLIFGFDGTPSTGQ